MISHLLLTRDFWERKYMQKEKKSMAGKRHPTSELRYSYSAHQKKGNRTLKCPSTLHIQFKEKILSWLDRRLANEYDHI